MMSFLFLHFARTQLRSETTSAAWESALLKTRNQIDIHTTIATCCLDRRTPTPTSASVNRDSSWQTSEPLLHAKRLAPWLSAAQSANSKPEESQAFAAANVSTAKHQNLLLSVLLAISQLRSETTSAAWALLKTRNQIDIHTTIATCCLDRRTPTPTSASVNRDSSWQTSEPLLHAKRLAPWLSAAQSANSKPEESQAFAAANVSTAKHQNLLLSVLLAISQLRSETTSAAWESALLKTRNQIDIHTTIATCCLDRRTPTPTSASVNRDSSWQTSEPLLHAKRLAPWISAAQSANSKPEESQAFAAANVSTAKHQNLLLSVLLAISQLRSETTSAAWESALLKTRNQIDIHTTIATCCLDRRTPTPTSASVNRDSSWQTSEPLLHAKRLAPWLSAAQSANSKPEESQAFAAANVSTAKHQNLLLSVLLAISQLRSETTSAAWESALLKTRNQIDIHTTIATCCLDRRTPTPTSASVNRDSSWQTSEPLLHAKRLAPWLSAAQSANSKPEESQAFAAANVSTAKHQNLLLSVLLAISQLRSETTSAAWESALLKTRNQIDIHTTIATCCLDRRTPTPTSASVNRDSSWQTSEPLLHAKRLAPWLSAAQNANSKPEESQAFAAANVSTAKHQNLLLSVLLAISQLRSETTSAAWESALLKTRNQIDIHTTIATCCLDRRTPTPTSASVNRDSSWQTSEPLLHAKRLAPWLSAAQNANSKPEESQAFAAANVSTAKHQNLLLSVLLAISQLRSETTSAAWGVCIAQDAEPDRYTYNNRYLLS